MSKDQPVDEVLHRKAENLAYWMYESSGNSKYVLAGRKPLHPDEATKMIVDLCQAECNRARIEELTLLDTFPHKTVAQVDVFGYTERKYTGRISELQQPLKGASNADQ